MNLSYHLNVETKTGAKRQNTFRNENKILRLIVNSHFNVYWVLTVDW